MEGSPVASQICASWEGFAVEQVLGLCEPDDAYFWATHQGAELDLLLFRNGKRYGVEVKRQDAPSVTASMRIAMKDLALNHLTVLYPGEQAYPIGRRMSVLPLSELASNPKAVYD